MVFECQQCGECCSIMGQVLVVCEDPGTKKYVLSNQYTGEKTTVEIDPDKVDLYEDRSTIERFPEACPFLRFNREDGRAYCTVHLTRPDMCRDFGCWRLLILRPDGRRAGRVMCQSHFCPDDSDLARLWEERIRPIDDPGGAEWDRSVISILTRAGYQVRI
ncbi:MAG TPA: YkgJ family cysteine cluster protein [Methanoregulaceae archaeon]|nr:MAG: YkgJ family cysteine cluster protein [Methanolinea sp.]HON82114.1 YkgJ family cysteine cluster protein [Methanoregulaceae archaeon]HPD10813.1 YkgJ family cysteine cluster protein [Methanoregulaceae archaeon]